MAILHSVFMQIYCQSFDLRSLQQHHDLQILPKVHLFSWEMSNGGIFGKFMTGTCGLILMEGEVVMTGVVIGIERGEADGLAAVHDYQRLLFNSFNSCTHIHHNRPIKGLIADSECKDNTYGYKISNRSPRSNLQSSSHFRIPQSLLQAG